MRTVILFLLVIALAFSAFATVLCCWGLVSHITEEAWAQAVGSGLLALVNAMLVVCNIYNLRRMLKMPRDQPCRDSKN